MPWINLLRGYWRTALLVLMISIGTMSLFPLGGFHNFINNLLEPQTPVSEHQTLACATDPDFSILSNSISVSPPTCPETDFSVSFDIENVGDLSYSGNLEVSFYQEDPNNAGAIFLNTATASLSGFAPGNVTTLNLPVTGTGPSFQLYIAVNDAGVTTTPITWPTSTQTECDYSDNVASVAVVPNPFTVSLEKIQDNTKCEVSLPDNGAARAFVLEGGNEVIAGYTFQWFRFGEPVFTGPIYSGMDEAEYQVVATHDASQCHSDTANITIIRDNASSPILEIVQNRLFDDCRKPNGKATVKVVDPNDPGGTGLPPGKYEYLWFEGNQVFLTPPIGTSEVENSLWPIFYSVYVKDKKTGCDNIATILIMDDPNAYPVPDITVTDVTSCVADNGALSARVDGKTTPFTFEWYIGPNVKPTPDFTEPDLTNLPPGEYTLVVTNKCPSDPVTVTIADNRITPVVNASLDAEQTSCNLSSPNGAVSASVDETAQGGAANANSGYTFEWFSGQTTSGSPIATGASVTGLASGTYTVLVTDATTGCFNSAEVFIPENLEIPVPTATVTHQDACDPPNGSLSANVNGETAGFSFYWFIGNIGTPSLTNADFTTAVVNDLLAGDYTLVVVNNVTQCESSPQVYTINDNTITPVINLLSLTDQGSCDLANPTGSISVNADGTTSGYSFRWFRGQNTLSANEITPSPGATIDGLTAGTYTLLVRNTATGCEATEEYTINDVTTIPAPTVTVTDQDACDPPNGALSATVGGVTSGFSFYWFSGVVGTPTLANADYTTATVTDLIAGDYTLVVVDDNNQCQSAPEVHTINDNTSIPVINLLSLTDQQSCDPSNPTGSISVDADGTTSGFSFRWFRGQNTLPANEITPSPGAAITGLTAGTYTLLVRHNTSGCEATEEYTISEATVIPSPTVVVTDQDACDPPNGSLSADVAGQTNGYSFYWFNGNVGTPVLSNADYTTASVTDLTAGDYTLVVVDDVNQCQSAPEVHTINDNTSIPVINLLSQTDQESCDPNNPTGSISVDADGTTSGYTFRWFIGQNTLPSNEITPSPGAAITGLDNGIYTVLARNDISGCQNTLEVTINENIVIPTLSANTIDLTNCSPLNGSITVNVSSGAPADYTFSWYDGAATKATPDYTETGNILSALDAGDYTVEAVNNLTNCAAAPITVTIADNTPTINITQTDIVKPSDCNTAAGELEVLASSSGSPVFTYEWFSGRAPFSGGSIGTGARITGLVSGVYTVIVTDQSTGCQADSAIDLPFDGAPEVLIDVTNTVNNNTCDPSSYNGEIAVQIEPSTLTLTDPGDDQNEYILHLYTGPNPTGTPITQVSPAVFTGLAPGDYTIVAEQNFSPNCPSVPILVTIEDDAVNPELAVTQNTPNTNCGPTNSNGIVEIEIDGGAAPTDYTINWFEGSDTGAPPLGTNFGVVTGINGERIEQLPGGFYTAEVTNNASACTTVDTYQVFDNQDIITITAVDMSIAPQDDCDPLNGSATVNAVREDGVAVPYNGTNYDFEWYDENLNLLPLPSPANSYTGLSPGSYFVVAINNTTGCRGSEVAFEIEDQTTIPVVTLTVAQPNISCDISNPVGSLEASVDGNLADYTIEWFEGENSTTTPLPGANVSGANGELAINLSAGFYTVRFTDTVTPGIGCSTTATMEVVDDLPEITISQADLVITPQDDCSPANGSATVNAVSEDGVPIAFNGSNYDFEWYDVNLNLLPAPSPANSYTGLAAGSYFVVAINANTGCRSSEVAFEIEDQTTLPVVTLTVTQPNISCDTSNPVGSLEASVDGNLSDYTIEWFEGENSTTTPLPGANVSGANGELAINLSAGFYTVRFTDTVTPGIGCSTTATMEVVDDFPDITISQADLAITPQDDCSPANGSATVNAVSEDGVATAFNGTNYDFEWYDENLNLLPVPSPVNSYTGLTAGSYFVVAINTTTGCRSSEVAFEIEDQTALPVVTLTVAQPNISCDASNPMGSLEASVDGNLADYTIEWFEGENSTTPPLPGANVGGTNGELAINLAAGFYTVRFTDTVTPGIGCLSTATMEIVDDQAQLTITQADLFLNPQDDCSPPNGAARVDTIREDGIPLVVNGTNYSFEWYDENMNLIPGSLNQITNIVAGQYFVVAINTTTGCRTDEVGFEILDETAPPVIELPSFMNPTRCDGLNQGGTLVVTSDGVSDINNYTYEWYVGGQPVSGSPFISNNFVADNLSPIEYTVVVTNNATGCSSVASYTLQTEVVTPFVSASSEPVTNCDAPNGSLFATVINTSATYDFNWYSGTDTSGSPAFSGQTVDGVGPGTYTVVAVDQADPTCISDPDTVIIEDARFDGFVVEITPEAPLTNCDPANPNGILSATVNGEITGYDYEWYLGTDTTAVPVAFGSVATGLTDTLYTVVAIDVITKCRNTASYTLESEFLPIPIPDTNVTDATSCVVGNGAIQATVGGNVKDYTFDWYPGDEVAGTPIFTGPDLVDLNTGEEYTVTATSNITGCTSDPITVVVGEDKNAPQFEYQVTNATCLDQNGTATIILEDSTNVVLIEWSNGVQGPELRNYPPGQYMVTVTDTLGCATSQMIEIGSEINVYNGVSPNGDGFNDIFHIDCIENFPNNIVRIYNRAGQLVYVHEGYDNTTVFFDGVGNEGIYLSGNEVPDGTYYYIVDKRDGSEPRAGYLELLR